MTLWNYWKIKDTCLKSFDSLRYVFELQYVVETQMSETLSINQSSIIYLYQTNGPYQRRKKK